MHQRTKKLFILQEFNNNFKKKKKKKKLELWNTDLSIRILTLKTNVL